MKNLKKRILSLITAAAVAFSALALPDTGILPNLAVTASAQSTYGHQGSGTADDPWQIATAQQWQYFAKDMVNAENSTYGDDYYKLTADITVDTNDKTAIFVGDSTEPFRGHFDGGGHTLTFNYIGIAGGAAPFRYVSGATIENLNVAGTINPGNKRHAAGIAGYVTGNTTISNCTSSVTISSSSSESGRFGGLVGSVESWVTLNINNCVFNGSMTQSGSFSSGGFVGYNLGTVNITDCLCAPGSIGVGMYSFVQNWDGSSTLTRAYSTYVSTYSKLNQGTRVYTSAPDSMLTKKITCADNAQYYAEGGALITGIDSSYEVFGTSMALPAFEVRFDGATLSSDNYDFAFKNSGGTTVSSITTPDTYTLTVSGKGNYAGSISKSFEVSGHKITVLSAQHGTVSPDKTTAVYNSTVTLTVTPESGYKLLGLSVKDTGGNDITVTDNRFAMPDSAVIVTPVFGLADTDIYYIDSNGEVQTPTEAVSALTDSSTALSSGWYLASGEITISSRVSVSDDVHLILKDGAVINIPKGIGVNENKKLTIYGQANNSGTLTITDPYYTDSTTGRTRYPAGIGGDHNNNCGTIVINGGTINATGASNPGGSNNSSAAIGGAYDRNAGNITINGGIIHATGGRYAAGIGGGFSDQGGTITINGGNIIAIGGDRSAGIGNGYGSTVGASISLSWSEITDSIYASSYHDSSGKGTVTLNRSFVLSSDGSAATTSNIGGKTIIPAYAVNVDNTENGTVSPGQTAYRLGSTVTLTVTPDSGYEIDSVKCGSTEIEPVAGVYSFEMPANDVTVSATFSPIPATAPTITAQPENLDLQNGADSGNVLTVAAQAIADHTLSYQWYSNTTNSNEGGSVINGATSASYTVPTNTDGTTYYYCVVTATHTNGQTATAVSDVATVTVTSKTAQTLTFAESTVSKTYGDAAFTITATGAETTVTYSSGNTDVATVNASTGEVTIVGAGEATITATAATDETYQEATASYTLTVNPKSVTITGLSVSDKVYDGTTDATVTGTAVIDGKVGNDDVSFVAGTAEFTDESAGADKTVTFSGYSLSGTAADNYTLSEQPASVTANITPKGVTVSGITASEKTYDGTTDAELVTTGATFVGICAGDTLTFTATGTFVSADVGENKTITISDLTLVGESAENYVLADIQQATTTAKITPRTLVIQAKDQIVELNGEIATGADKVKVTDGSLADGQSITAVTLTGSSTAAVTTSGTITPSAATIMSGDTDVTSNYEITYLAGNLTVTKVKAKVTTAPTAVTGLIYDGTAHELVTGGTASGGTMGYSLTEDGTYSETVPTGTDAKTYTVYYKVVGDANHSDTEPQSIDVVIAKEASSVASAPTANALTYNGSALALVTAGTANGGTMQYSLDDQNYSEDIPTGTDAKTYTVYYKVVGDENHSDTAPQSITASIAKADATCTAPTANNLTYTGSAQELVSAGSTTDGTMQYKLGADGTYGTTIPKAAEVGSYTVYYKVVGDGNHNDTEPQSVDVNVGKASDKTLANITRSINKNSQNISISVASAVPADAGTISGYALNGAASTTGSVTVSGAEVSAAGLVTATLTDGAAGDTITVPVKITAQNYDCTISVVVTLNDLTDPVYTAPTAKILTYSGSAQELVTAGTVTTGGTMQYSTDGAIWSTTVPTGTNAGSYTVYYKVEATAEVNGVEAVPVNVSIARKAAVVTADNKNRTTLESDPELTATVTGLVGSDTVNYTLSRAAGEDIGTYTITPSGDTEQGNYTVTYQTGTFTITEGVIAVTSISLNKTSTTLTVGDTDTLIATVLPADATDKTVTWTSDNTAVATVANGVVTAKSAGTAKITAAAGGKSATCVVTVKAANNGGNSGNGGSGGSGGYIPSYPTYPTGGSTTTTTTNTNEPKIEGGSGASGWSNITSEIGKTPSGGSVTIDMNGTTTVPTNGLNAVKGKDVELVLDMGGGITWKINGKDITSVSGSIDLGVKLGTSGIPVEVRNNVTNEKYSTTLHLNHNGNFGFKAVMTVPLRKQDAGLIANLFYYNPSKKTLEFVSSAKIDANGNAELDFNHASDYAIVIDDHSLGGRDVTAKTTGNKVKLTWDAAPGAESYTVYIKKNDKYKEFKTTSKAALTVSGLKNGKTYEFLIRYSVDGKLSEIADSYKVSVTAKYKPIVSLTADEGSITIKWSKVENAEEYKVFKYVNGKLKLVTETDKRSVRITGTKAGKEYSYAVKAYVDGKWTTVSTSDIATVKAK